MRWDRRRVGRREEVANMQGGTAVPHVICHDCREEPA